MTHFEHYLSGNVFGIKYTFDAADDGLPWHTHDVTKSHNVCVLSGQVDVLFEDQIVHLRTGDVYDFDGERRHSIIAVTPSCILNLFLNGQPVEYKNLSPHELKGAFDVRNFTQR